MKPPGQPFLAVLDVLDLGGRSLARIVLHDGDDDIGGTIEHVGATAAGVVASRAVMYHSDAAAEGIGHDVAVLDKLTHRGGIAITLARHSARQGIKHDRRDT